MKNLILGVMFSLALLLTISAGRTKASNQPLQIVTTKLPVVVEGVHYRVRLHAIGGHHPYSWVVSSGSLPPGLSLTHRGVIRGVVTGLPTTPTDFPFTVQVTDSATATSSDTINNLDEDGDND